MAVTATPMTSEAPSAAGGVCIVSVNHSATVAATTAITTESSTVPLS